MGLIYEPRGRAREYAALAVNVYSGCDHGCVYCYVPLLPWAQSGAHPTPKLRKAFSIEKLEREAAQLQERGVSGRVLLCFMTDPYQRLEINNLLTHRSVVVLHSYGFDVQILTKNPLRAHILDTGIYHVGDAIAATLTFSREDWQKSARWEPNAPTPGDRYAGLEAFHRDGIPTWASLEPVIDPASTLRIIEETAGFVDHYKVGRINYVERLPIQLRAEVEHINWRAFVDETVLVLQRLGYEEIPDPAMVRKGTFYVKESLRQFPEASQ